MTLANDLIIILDGVLETVSASIDTYGIGAIHTETLIRLKQSVGDTEALEILTESRRLLIEKEKEIVSTRELQPGEIVILNMYKEGVI